MHLQMLLNFTKCELMQISTCTFILMRIVAERLSLPCSWCKVSCWLSACSCYTILFSSFTCHTHSSGHFPPPKSSSECVWSHRLVWSFPVLGVFVPVCCVICACLWKLSSHYSLFGAASIVPLRLLSLFISGIRHWWFPLWLNEFINDCPRWRRSLNSVIFLLSFFFPPLSHSDVATPGQWPEQNDLVSCDESTSAA